MVLEVRGHLANISWNIMGMVQMGNDQCQTWPKCTRWCCEVLVFQLELIFVAGDFMAYERFLKNNWEYVLGIEDPPLQSNMEGGNPSLNLMIFHSSHGFSIASINIEECICLGLYARSIRGRKCLPKDTMVFTMDLLDVSSFKIFTHTLWIQFRSTTSIVSRLHRDAPYAPFESVAWRFGQIARFPPLLAKDMLILHCLSPTSSGYAYYIYIL